MDTVAPFERAQGQEFDDASVGRGKDHVRERAAVRPNDHPRSFQMTAVHLPANQQRYGCILSSKARKCAQCDVIKCCKSNPLLLRRRVS